MTATLAPSLPEALAHHQRGELEHAVQIYREVLAAQPDDPEALHLLGVALLQCGQPRKAVELIERAIARKPSAAVFHGNLAEAYRACGQLQRAVACCQLALRLQPKMPNVAYNLGCLLMQMGKIAEAASVYRIVLQQQPNHPLVHNNLGNACRFLGDNENALAHFRRALELDPKQGCAHGNLGQLLVDMGRTEEALIHCQEAVRLLPESASAHNNLGNVYRKLGQFNEAKGCYTRALQFNPNIPIIHDNIGRVMSLEGRYEEALPWFNQALGLAPNTADFHCHLAEALIELRRFGEADQHLNAALQLQPHDPTIRFSLGRLRHEQGRLEEAQTEYRTILCDHPEHPVVNQHLGELLLELSQTEDALACFRAALRGNPRFTPPLAHLASNLREKLPAPERAALMQLVADPSVPETERAALLYGVAQVLDAEGAYDEAARNLAQANAIELAHRKNCGRDYNAQAHNRFVDQLLNVFTPAFFDRVRGLGLDSERPVFIIGLPRSGTTLLEQVLASHSRIHGAGELFLSREGFEKLGNGSDGIAEGRAFEAIQSINADTIRELAQTHLDRLAAINGTAERVIDKMPENYLYVGFLAMLFPKARFLHCRRDPRDVAVSCWITQFRAITWANDPEQLASRFAQYQRVMEHWQRVLPDCVLDVEYEDMVNDLESVARRVIAFCGLEWEPACLEYHRTRRPIRTASITQVRQPIYRRSVQRWRHYEKSLRPLFDRLQGAHLSSNVK